MTEATGLTSFTLHRLLKWDPAARKFVFGRGNQLPYDLYVLDETSMLDILLALARTVQIVKAGIEALMEIDDDDDEDDDGGEYTCQRCRNSRRS